MSTNPNNATFDRMYLRVSAIVLFLGELLFGIAGYLHPAHEPANNHAAVFAEYASSTNWTLVHLGQFAGMLVIIAGLLVLFRALNVRMGMAGLAAQGAAVSAVVTLSLYGILQAIDGVALKQVVDALGKCTGGRESSSLCECRGDPIPGVGRQELSGLYAGYHLPPVCDCYRRDCQNS